ncbi:Hsp20/alpha crystallin family protein, partial [Candidatus Dependentiae bacterium]
HWEDWENELNWAAPKWGEDVKSGLFRVEVPFPGYDEKDIKVIIDKHPDGTPFLDIEAECKEEHDEEKDQSKAWFHGSSFAERHVSLPHNIDVDSAEAKFENGIVMVTFKTNKEGVHKMELAFKK